MDSAKQYIIFNSSELDKINFSEVLETSVDTVRLSVDGSKTFVKYISNDMPTSVASLTTKEGPYQYDEFLTILETPNWTLQNTSGSIN
jgi:hypothetical protein